MSGEVVGMQVFALREVIGPDEPILRIVPQDADLVVVARLQPIYVDQVYPGQAAVLRFSAFPSRTTPRFDGRIVRVSADVAHDEGTDRSWYEVEVAMGDVLAAEWDTRAWLKPALEWLRDHFPQHPGLSIQTEAGGRHARDLALTPGMPVEVHIRTGERSPPQLPCQTTYGLLLAVDARGLTLTHKVAAPSRTPLRDNDYGRGHVGAYG